MRIPVSKTEAQRVRSRRDFVVSSVAGRVSSLDFLVSYTSSDVRWPLRSLVVSTVGQASEVEKLGRRW